MGRPLRRRRLEPPRTLPPQHRPNGRAQRFRSRLGRRHRRGLANRQPRLRLDARRSGPYLGRQTARIDDAESLQLQPRSQPKLTVYPIHPNEKEDIARIRDYEIRSGGKTYKIYRGDTHRHTEFSMDGFNDGSLQQAYRYAIDAASLDYYANTEHNFLGGPDVEYHDWLLQQFVEFYDLPGAFTPFFAYERSVRYPNGHRNILFAERGIHPFAISLEEHGLPTFPFATAEATARSANPKSVGTKDLYAYLKKNGGISIPHTSSTNMGTDWRDNDPEVEPLVEIYQGDRTSAEYEGAPRASNRGNPRSAPGGFRPAGFVWNAWAKGYKLGVQAASDHVSTHISYACTIAESSTREGLLDAMRKRHSYGATRQHRSRLPPTCRGQRVPARRHRDRSGRVSPLGSRNRNATHSPDRCHQEPGVRLHQPEPRAGRFVHLRRRRAEPWRELLLCARSAGGWTTRLVFAHLGDGRGSVSPEGALRLQPRVKTLGIGHSTPKFSALEGRRNSSRRCASSAFSRHGFRKPGSSTGRDTKRTPLRPRSRPR